MNFYIHSPHVKWCHTLCKWPLILTMQKKYTAEQFLLCFIRLTWSLPPHSPAGRFAHKLCSPLLLLSISRQDLHLSRTMLTTFRCLCGSFCLRLASTFNHRPVMYFYYIHKKNFCHSLCIMIFFFPII